MSEPATGFFALIFGFFAAEPIEIRPQPNPLLMAGDAVCEIAIDRQSGQQALTARVTAAQSGLNGSYVLKLDGKGGSKVTIRDERDLSLAPGEVAVLSRLDLAPNVRLSGQLVMKAADGSELCRSKI